MNCKPMSRIAFTFIITLFWIAAAPASPCLQDREDSLSVPSALTWTYTFPDSSGTLTFPVGTCSFADTVILYDPGSTGAETGGEPDTDFQKPESALGVPDWSADDRPGFVALGSGGTLILQFSDNVLLDGPGPDLCIFLADTDDVNVWISHDGRIFHFAGRASRKKPCIDILPCAEPGFVYPFVKIRDDPLQGGETNPALGADIDAVGAVNTAMYFILPSDSLFQEGTSNLMEESGGLLEDIAAKIRRIPRAHVTIEGHTSDRGSEEFNLVFSQLQAGSIRDYLMDHAHIGNAEFTLIGRGGRIPAAPNDSETGRMRNRRIEVFIQTHASWKSRM
jgi:OOP family OmpA-OmpF porin